MKEKHKFWLVSKKKNQALNGQVKHERRRTGLPHTFSTRFVLYYKHVFDTSVLLQYPYLKCILYTIIQNDLEKASTGKCRKWPIRHHQRKGGTKGVMRIKNRSFKRRDLCMARWSTGAPKHLLPAGRVATCRSTESAPCVAAHCRFNFTVTSTEVDGRTEKGGMHEIRISLASQTPNKATTKICVAARYSSDTKEDMICELKQDMH